MKIHSMLLLMLLVSSQLVKAQTDMQVVDNEVDAEIDQIYSTQQAQKKVKEQPAYQTSQTTRRQNHSAVVTQTIVVPQQSYAQEKISTEVQKQPTTFIEATPITDSKAEVIRKSRQEEEMKTETRIVEKLEQSRMEDEKRRASILFGDKFNQLQQQQQTAEAQSAASQHASSQVVSPSVAPVVVAPVQPIAQPVAPTATAVSAPVSNAQLEPATPMAPAVMPVYIEPQETLSRDAVREEVRAALKDDETAIVAPTETRYFAGLAGIGEYPDVNNVKGNYVLGAAFGTRYDYLMVEGSFVMSNYSVDLTNRNYVNYYKVDNYEVNQYQGNIGAKYQLMGGMVRPVLGGLIGYSYRKFTLTNSYSGSAEDTGNSHAIDLGVIAGVDLEFNPKFSLGFDFKYMFNLSSRVNSNYPNSSYSYVGTPIEKLQYYVAGIAARVNF